MEYIKQVTFILHMWILKQAVPRAFRNIQIM